MGKVHDNKITTTSGFKLNAYRPLDDREVVETYDDLSGLYAYEGMKVYVIDEKKNYQYIDEEWQSSESSEGNFKNGEGSGSIVQKNGGVTSSNGETPAAEAIARGESATAVNARTEANGPASFAQGYNSKAHTKADAVFNAATAGLTQGDFEKAYPNGYFLSSTGEYLSYSEFKKRVTNNGFAVNGGRAIAINSFSCGGHSAGKGSFASNSATFGEQCMTVAQPYKAESGETGDAKNSLCGGEVSYVYAKNSLGYGMHLTVPYMVPDTLPFPLSRSAFGQYNLYQTYGSPWVFAVGNGTSDTSRSNAFTVLLDGRAKVQTAPKENDDVVRYGDLQNMTIKNANKAFSVERYYQYAAMVQENGYTDRGEKFDFTEGDLCIISAQFKEEISDKHKTTFFALIDDDDNCTYHLSNASGVACVVSVENGKGTVTFSDVAGNKIKAYYVRVNAIKTSKTLIN